MILKKYVLSTVLLLLTFSGNSFARGDIPIEGGGDFLIGACQEVVEIYNARGEGKFIASQRTSLNEGIKAGYCLGVVSQHCDGFRGNVIKIATRIANISLVDSKGMSTSSLLRKAAHCGY